MRLGNKIVKKYRKIWISAAGEKVQNKDLNEFGKDRKKLAAEVVGKRFTEFEVERIQKEKKTTGKKSHGELRKIVRLLSWQYMRETSNGEKT